MATKSAMEAAPDSADALDEAYPSGTQFRLASIAMALGGARELANDILAGDDKGCGVLGILDLALAELMRIDDGHDALKAS